MIYSTDSNFTQVECFECERILRNSHANKNRYYIVDCIPYHHTYRFADKLHIGFDDGHYDYDGFYQLRISNAWK